MSKEILIITNYFPPETGAASNRIYHLANGLQENGFIIKILTPLPNYPKGRVFSGYRGKIKSKTIENGLSIYRLWIFASNSKNKILRLIAMLSYSFSLMFYFLFNKVPKTVIIQSPPLLVAFTSILFLKSSKRNLILNVSDLWPIAGLELGALKKGTGYNILEGIERFNYKNANLVLGQSYEILEHVLSLFPSKEVFLYRNYPDFTPPELIDSKPSKKIRVVYAGLLGIAQGISKLIHELDYSNIEFHIYGSGAEQAQIENYLNQNNQLPVFYHGEVSRDELHRVLIDYDVTIIPLVNRIYGSVPSKIFEYARLGLPILYFGGGEGETIILEHDLGWVVESSNYKMLNTVLKGIRKEDLTLSFRERIQKKAVEQFNFQPQLNKLKANI